MNGPRQHRSRAFLLLLGAAVLAACGGGGGDGGGGGGDPSTLMGYVGTVGLAPQAATPPVLALYGQPPAQPVEWALVEVTTGANTETRRTQADGSFAVEVPAGQCTVTAYPPADRTSEFSPSDPLQVTTVAGQVTLPDGSTAGPPTVLRWDEFWPLRVRDMRYGRKTDDGDVRHEWNLIIGTAVVGSDTTYVSLTPTNNPWTGGGAGAPKRLPSAPGDMLVSDVGQLFAHGADSALIYYGSVDLVRRAGGTLEFVACLWETPAVVPALRLGQGFTASSPTQSQVINVALPAGITPEDFVDPAAMTYPYEGCPSEQEVVMAFTAAGVRVNPDAGVFTDTVTTEGWDERTIGNTVETDVWHNAYARHVGEVQYSGIQLERATGQSMSQNVMVGSYGWDLIYALVNGTEYGTPPGGGGGAPKPLFAR